MDSTQEIHEVSAKKFIDHCKLKFGWSDLSKDVVMEIGCGEEGYCGRLICEEFPDVRAMIFTDKRQQVVLRFKRSYNMGNEVNVLDIEKRDHIQRYEGRMTKVISTNVFHQLEKKEEAFRNVYRLLKPGGEATVLFVIQSLVYGWLTEMLQNPKWKEVYKGHYAEQLYKSEHGAAHYKEMVERIGFQVVECSEERRVFPSESDESCKDALYKLCGHAFRLSPELLEEFKEESFQVLLRISERDEEGRACYRSNELSLLLVKPAEAPGS